jgi:uncharacterized SAM-binding protein YcdF (DUF218 family)
MSTPGRLLRWVLGLAGLAFLANAAWLALTRNLNLGMALVAAVGLALLAWGVWLERLSRMLWLTLTCGVAAAGVIAVSVFLAVYGSIDTATGDEDAVIVLGAAVHGSEPSNTLVGRLDAALAYHQRNPSALIVVSGGQGFQEDLPEGVAMRDYLVAHGVPDAEVLVEDRASSTVENFAFSKALLDARLAPGYRVVFVTDDFHVFRAGRIAAAAGLDATHVASSTSAYFWASNYLRETVAVVASLAGTLS